jgi:hypothetical protein
MKSALGSAGEGDARTNALGSGGPGRKGQAPAAGQQKAPGLIRVSPIIDFTKNQIQNRELRQAKAKGMNATVVDLGFSKIAVQAGLASTAGILRTPAGRYYP